MQAAVPGCFVKRWWGRGPQKSPPETFVRGLAVPPCSTPVTMLKKDPKKLCAFWGFISVPVVDGLPRASKVSTGDFCARLSRAALFDPRDHAKKRPQKALRLLGFYISAGGGGLPRASKVSTGDFCARLCRAALFDPRAHATKEKPQKALRLLGFYISAGGGRSPAGFKSLHRRLLCAA